jgi:hypothetical protein
VRFAENQAVAQSTHNPSCFQYLFLNPEKNAVRDIDRTAKREIAKWLTGPNQGDLQQGAEAPGKKKKFLRQAESSHIYRRDWFASG